MTVTLVLPGQVADELFEATAAAVESAGVLLAKYVETPGGIHVCSHGRCTGCRMTPTISVIPWS